MLVMIKLMVKLKLFLTLLNIKRFDATLGSFHFKIRKHVDNVYRMVVIELNNLSENLQLVTKVVRLKSPCQFSLQFWLLITDQYCLPWLFTFDATLIQRRDKLGVRLNLTNIFLWYFSNNAVSYFSHWLSLNW